MPTTLPLDDGDDDGGQLKPIALDTVTTAQKPAAARPATQPSEASNGSQTPPADTSAPSAAPAAAQATARPAATPYPVVRGTPLRTTLRTPSFGRTAPRSEAKQTVTTPAPKVWDKQFTEHEFVDRWHKIMESLQNQPLLQNTMRASVPVRIEGTHYVMTVENSIQVDLVREALPSILASLRKSLINDTITIDVHANDGVPSPETWNDRQVLADIVDHNPIVRDMIATLHLTLY